MIVISDTSPIHYLVLTDTIDILAALFAETVVPPAVLAELLHPHAPQVVREWASKLPEWLAISSPATVDPRLELGPGEAEAISLAIETHATLLLMDDRRARREAEARGLSVAGTVSVLAAASKRGLIDLATTIAKLRQTNFHIADSILDRVLKEDAERKQGIP
ncbi:MAG TPA: DUF3368 domain-containing protein [Pirellulales bacterium]|nr:DUF3368 domain-containing protein [Pirellulales bacterium]